jgi:hypothetical protein
MVLGFITKEMGRGMVKKDSADSEARQYTLRHAQGDKARVMLSLSKHVEA